MASTHGIIEDPVTNKFPPILIDSCFQTMLSIFEDIFLPRSYLFQAHIIGPSHFNGNDLGTPLEDPFALKPFG